MLIKLLCLFIPIKTWRQKLRHLFRDNIYKKYCKQQYKKIKKINPDFQKKSIALMTVFIMKENVLFLEEWIQHNIIMGVDHIFLYDNSNVQKPGDFDLNINAPIVFGIKNKMDVNYGKLISDDKAKRIYKNILKKYKKNITTIPWEKKDKDGFIRYFQKDAYLDFITKNKYNYDYGLFIDMDEYMVSENDLTLKDIIIQMEKNEISTAYFYQRWFESRFNHLDKKVREITVSARKDIKHARKCFVKLNLFDFNIKPGVHTVKTIFKNEFINSNDMKFHHYKMNGFGNKKFIEKALFDLMKENEVYKEMFDIQIEKPIENKDALKYLIIKRWKDIMIKDLENE